jgi:pimeloyl-ACP methyl ester carboxylesterase
MVSSGHRSDAVRFWMTDVVQAPAEMVTMMERFPTWAGLEALAHTLPYDLAVAGDQGVPAGELAQITVPVLIIGGGRSPGWFRQTVEATAAVTPGARLVMIDGQDHGILPEVIGPVLTEFFLGS